MDIYYCTHSYLSLYPITQKHFQLLPVPLWERNFFNFKISSSCGCKRQHQNQRKWLPQRPFIANAMRRDSMELNQEEKPQVKVAKKKKKGTVIGAVALIIGTTIGSGLLALPRKASPAGIIPSSISIVVCWGFLLLEALLLVEINVGLWERKRKTEEDDKEEEELDVISIRTMAQETLGEWGGYLATVTYVFLGYSSLIAYSSKSGEVLSLLINLPESISGCFFTAIFTMLISFAGTAATDQVNQWLTASMIGLLLVIEVLAFEFGGWSGFHGNGDWGKVPSTIPVIIFSLVYHDLAPVLCAYLGGDLRRLRVSILLGSLVPFLALLVWDAIALGLSAHTDQVVDPVELLMSVRWSGMSYLVEAFSLLAVGTSLIGTLLGFSEFFKEQLKNLSSTTQIPIQEQQKVFGLGNWWERNRISLTAMAIVVTPTLLVSNTLPDAFSAATDIAGGYCMTMLYGVLPPAMAWAMNETELREDKSDIKSKACTCWTWYICCWTRSSTNIAGFYLIPRTLLTKSSKN